MQNLKVGGQAPPEPMLAMSLRKDIHTISEIP